MARWRRIIRSPATDFSRSNPASTPGCSRNRAALRSCAPSAKLTATLRAKPIDVLGVVHHVRANAEAPDAVGLAGLLDGPVDGTADRKARGRDQDERGDVERNYACSWRLRYAASRAQRGRDPAFPGDGFRWSAESAAIDGAARSRPPLRVQSSTARVGSGDRMARGIPPKQAQTKRSCKQNAGHRMLGWKKAMRLFPRPGRASFPGQAGRIPPQRRSRRRAAIVQGSQATTEPERPKSRPSARPGEDADGVGW